MNIEVFLFGSSSNEDYTYIVLQVSGTEDGPELVQHLDNLAKRFTEIK